MTTKMKRYFYLIPILLIAFTAIQGKHLPESDVINQFSILEKAGKLLRSSTYLKDEKGWSHFYEAETNNILLSIKPANGEALPQNTEVSCGLLSAYGLSAHEYSPSFIKENTAFFTMNRYWRIDAPETEKETNYKVRFYFSKQDINDLKASFQELGYTSPEIDQLSFYTLEGSNTHPFSHDLDKDIVKLTEYSNAKNRGIVISNRFNYVEFIIKDLNSSGSGGFKKDLKNLNFWLKGNIASNYPEHLDRIRIKDINQDIEGHRASRFGSFSIPLQGGSRDIAFGFSFAAEDLPYLNINDLIRLKEHLSGENPIEDDMLLHAADMDNNGSVDKYDYEYLFKLVKGERAGFSAKTAYSVMSKEDWKTLNSSKGFFTPENTYTINQVKKDIEQDFILVVKGDLDQEKQSTSPSINNILSMSKVNSCGLGETKTVELYGSLEDGIQGIQFSISWNPSELELLEIKDSIGKQKHMEYFNTNQISDGLLGFTCIDKRKLQAKHGKLIFAKLIFKVIEQTPNAAIRFSDYPSNIHVLNKASENISIHLEEGRILEDKERSIPINNTEIKQPTCNKPKSGYIAIHADQNIFSDMVIWNDGATGLTRKNLPEGIYSYKIQAKGKCTLESEPIIFKVPEKPEIKLKTLKPLNCLDGSDASIEINVEGGKEPYYYYWNNDSRSAKTEHLSAGDYYVEVIDDNNCKVTAGYEIESNGHLGLEYFVKSPSSNSTADGVIEITNVYGVNMSKSNWVWQSGSKGQRIEKLSPDYYTVKFEGSEGCSYTKTFNLKPSRSSFQTKAFFYESDVQSGFDLAKLSITSPVSNNLTINLFNAVSEVVWSNSYRVQSGQNIYYIPVPKESGDYILQIPKVLSQRFTIE